MNQTRRAFVKASGLALVSMGLDPIFLTRAAYAARATARGSSAKTLICVFQRGAVDGLSMLVPYGDSAYYQLRDGTAIPRPGQEGGAIDLDGRFGLHPALEPLFPLYADGLLAPIHAVGSHDPTRSHFDGQDYMETGTPGLKATKDGWINRYLAHSREHTETPFTGVAIGQTMPRALQGARPVLAVNRLE
ncbi:MAG: hypothetical protein HKO70_08525, partial [Acidimicrobiia bacterium]|nr:hypothetical protein [Acidimicrobiia bacterium]